MADAASPKKRGRPAKKDAEHKEKEVRRHEICQQSKRFQNVSLSK